MSDTPTVLSARLGATGQASSNSKTIIHALVIFVDRRLAVVHHARQ